MSLCLSTTKRFFVMLLLATWGSLYLVQRATAGDAPASDARLITLEQANDRVLATDQSIQSAYWEIRKARLEPLRALTRVAPSITGSGGMARSSRTSRATTTETVFSEPALLGATGSTSTRSITSTSTTRADNGSLGITYQQTILDLSVIPAFRLGKLTATAAQLTYRYTIREVLYGLSEAYYEVLKQQRIAQVSAETLRLAEEQLALAKSRAEVGEVTRSDVLRAQVTVETNRQFLIETENTLLSRKNNLANILNLAPGTHFSVTEPAAAKLLEGNAQTLFAQARGRREDLQVRLIAVQQDVQRRNEVSAQYAPKVVAQVNADRSSTSGTSQSRDRSWDASLTVQVPFFTGGQREIDLAQAGYQIRQTQLDYENYLKTVQQDITDAWLRARTLQATLQAVRVQVEAAQQAYQDLRNQYQAGTATSVDVLSALNDLNSARRDLATQTYDYQVALRNIQQVTGVYQQERIKKLKFK